MKNKTLKELQETVAALRAELETVKADCERYYNEARRYRNEARSAAAGARAGAGAAVLTLQRAAWITKNVPLPPEPYSYHDAGENAYLLYHDNSDPF